MEKFAVYSLQDTQTVLNHPNVGQCVLSDCGGGKITISRAGDMSSHTQTANGYVVVNRLLSRSGTVALEIPQNSDADLFLRKWAKYLENCPVSKFALSNLTVTDNATGRSYSMTGVTLQKRPDVSYDQTSAGINYGLLAAEIVET